ELASKVYFNTTTSKLTLEQSAMLVAMLKNPVLYNPLRNPENATRERNVVLNQMVKYKLLSEEDAKIVKEKPLGLNKQEINTISESYSAYYKQALRREIQTYLDSLGKQTGKKYNLYKDGLKIYVTLDSRLQKLAEDAVAKHLKTIQKTFFEEQKNNKRAP